MENANVVNLNDFNEEVMEGADFEMEQNQEVVAKGNNELVKGLAIGLGTGLAIGFGAWFYERKLRLKVLKELEVTVKMAQAIREGKQSMMIGKKEVLLVEKRLGSGQELVEYIMDNLEKTKMRKNERKRWIDVTKDLLAHMEAYAKESAKKQIIEGTYDINEMNEEN